MTTLKVLLVFLLTFFLVGSAMALLGGVGIYEVLLAAVLAVVAAVAYRRSSALPVPSGR